MKQMNRWLLVASLIIASASSSASADQPSKPSSTSKRPASKPSVLKSWSDGVRLTFQSWVDYAKYVQGNGPARYN